MQDSFKLHVNQHREVQNRVTVNSFAAKFSGNGLRKKLNEHEKSQRHRIPFNARPTGASYLMITEKCPGITTNYNYVDQRPI